MAHRVQELITIVHNLITVVKQLSQNPNLVNAHAKALSPPPNNVRRDERRGDNFDSGYMPAKEFKPPKGLENVKLQMPSFASDSSVDEYLGQEDKVEALFECYDIEDHIRVRLTVVKFTRYATLQ